MAITINGTGTITGIAEGGLPDGSISAADIAAGTISANAIADGAISSTKIASATIAANNIADSAVSTAKIADDAVTEAKWGGNQLSCRNLIINGDMRIAQRGTSFTGLTNGSGAYTLDRWNWLENGAPSFVMTVAQDTDAPDGFNKSLKLSTTTAQASLDATILGRFRYSIEGQDLQRFAWGTSSAKQVTLSFWVKSNKTGDLVWYWHHYASGTNQTTSKTFTINTADTWEYKTITFAASSTTPSITDNALGSYLEFIFAAGSNYTSGTADTDWQNTDATNRAAGITINLADSTSNYLNITGVQLEVGSTATPFEYRSYGEELAKCQRYYYQNGDNVWYCYLYRGDVRQLATVHYPTTMRSEPTVTNTWNDDGGVGESAGSPVANVNWCRFVSAGSNSNTVQPSVSDLTFDAEL